MWMCKNTFFAFRSSQFIIILIHGRYIISCARWHVAIYEQKHIQSAQFHWFIFRQKAKNKGTASTMAKANWIEIAAGKHIADAYTLFQWLIFRNNQNILTHKNILFFLHKNIVLLLGSLPNGRPSFISWGEKRENILFSHPELIKCQIGLM